jgi:hypothetical protein
MVQAVWRTDDGELFATEEDAISYESFNKRLELCRIDLENLFGVVLPDTRSICKLLDRLPLDNYTRASKAVWAARKLRDDP